jgi:hypothetical protein
MRTDDAGGAKRDRQRARLSAALRENLRRRKAQSRARASEAPPPEKKDAPASSDSER